MKRPLTTALYMVAAASLTLLQGCQAYVYDRHHWHGAGWWHLNSTVDHPAEGATEAPLTLFTSAALLRQDYGLGAGSAEKIIRLAQGDPNVAMELAISDDEFAAFRRLEMPPSETIQRIATRLGEDPIKIEKVLNGFIVDIRAERNSDML